MIARGHKGPGVEEVAAKSHKCKGADRTRASIEDVGRAQGDEWELERVQVYKEATGEAYDTICAIMSLRGPQGAVGEVAGECSTDG